MKGSSVFYASAEPNAALVPLGGAGSAGRVAVLSLLSAHCYGVWGHIFASLVGDTWFRAGVPRGAAEGGG